MVRYAKRRLLLTPEELAAIERVHDSGVNAHAFNAYKDAVERFAMRNGSGPLEVFDPLEIFERDGWCCKKCGVETPAELRATENPNSPTLDHRIPLATCGSHTRTNSQLLCLRCNYKKNDGRKTLDVSVCATSLRTLLRKAMEK
jgi:hypothetical protein